MNLFLTAPNKDKTHTLERFAFARVNIYRCQGQRAERAFLSDRGLRSPISSPATENEKVDLLECGCQSGSPIDAGVGSPGAL